MIGIILLVVRLYYLLRREGDRHQLLASRVFSNQIRSVLSFLLLILSVFSLVKAALPEDTRMLSLPLGSVYGKCVCTCACIFMYPSSAPRTAQNLLRSFEKDAPCGNCRTYFCLFILATPGSDFMHRKQKLFQEEVNA